MACGVWLVAGGWRLPGFVAERIHRDEYVPLSTTVDNTTNYEKGLLRLLEMSTV